MKSNYAAVEAGTDVRSDSTLLERVDDFSRLFAAPGFYHTSTGHQAYAVLKALGWHPRVALYEELFFPEGSVLFAEVKPYRRVEANPPIEKMPWGVEPDYYERLLRDYDNWEVAFWREVLQNSRDAGATRLDVEVREDVYEDAETGDKVQCMRVSATDDGTGMDYDTLVRAFFRKGGTQKPPGATGGFGDAKNLILVPWLGYEVETRDVLARGRHQDVYLPMERDRRPGLKGTRVTVWMPLTKTTTAEHAQFLFEQCSLALRFTINGKLVKETLPQGDKVFEWPIVYRGSGQPGLEYGQKIGDLLIYHSPRARRHGVYVRSRGIYMFEIHGYTGDFKGVVTVEVNAPPIGVFTTKRDALSGESTARADTFGYLKFLASDPKKMLKRVRDKKEVIFRGTGVVEVRKGKVAELAAGIAAKAELQQKASEAAKGIKLSAKEVENLAEQMKRALGVLEKDEGEKEPEKEGEQKPEPLPPTAEVKPLPATFQTAIAQTTFASVEQIVGAVQLAMWKPDFFLYQNISPFHVPKALHPETMATKYHLLLRAWTEICKFLLVQFGMFEPFGVGWIFEAEWSPDGETVVLARFRKHKGENWLLLNPVVVLNVGTSDDPKYQVKGDRFDLSKRADVEELVAMAVHEITHMQGYGEHTDAYASALTKNMKAVFRLAPVLDKIVREVRVAVREERAMLEAKRPAEEPAAERSAIWPKTGDLADPRWHRLWGLYLMVLYRKFEEPGWLQELGRAYGVELSTYEKDAAKELKVAVARFPEKVQRIIDEDIPSLRGRLPLKLHIDTVRRLAWGGQEAWSAFVYNLHADVRGFPDSADVSNLVTGVDMLYDTIDLQKKIARL